MALVHWRLALGAVIALVAWGLASLIGAPSETRLLIGWDVGGAAYLALMWRGVFRLAVSV